MPLSDETKQELRHRCPTPEEVDALLAEIENWRGCYETRLSEIADLRQRLEAEQGEAIAANTMNDLGNERIRTLEALVHRARPILAGQHRVSWQLVDDMDEALAQPPAQDGGPKWNTHRWAERDGTGASMCADCGVDLDDDESARPCPAHQPAAEPRSGESEPTDNELRDALLEIGSRMVSQATTDMGNYYAVLPDVFEEFERAIERADRERGE